METPDSDKMKKFAAKVQKFAWQGTSPPYSMSGHHYNAPGPSGTTHVPTSEPIVSETDKIITPVTVSCDQNLIIPFASKAETPVIIRPAQPEKYAEADPYSDYSEDREKPKSQSNIDLHPSKSVSSTKSQKSKQKRITDDLSVKKRKLNRFNGMSEEEVLKRTLPDYLKPNLDIVFVGINPGLAAAYAGHYYTGPGNHFWKCLHLSGITSEPMSAPDDYKLLSHGIGFTNMVSRTTRGSPDLSRAELVEGGKILTEKVQKFRPKILVFNGKISYEVFSGKKKFYFGKQVEVVEGTETHIWVMPSSSARCAQLPRAVDKVPFFEALLKFRNYINGDRVGVKSEDEFVFKDIKLTNAKKEAKDS